MNKILILFTIFSLVTTSLFSQTVNKIEPLCDTCEKELYFRFESTSFLKNNEYFNNFSEGFTGIGYFIKPTFEYYLTYRTKINAGVYLLKYSGLDNFSYLTPVFSIQHNINKYFSLIIGCIYGSLSHQLEEPLYRYDRYYQDNIENGLQFLWNSTLIQSDLWVNWKKFILKDDPFQEEIIGGNTTKIHILKSKKINLTIPIQLLVFHKGGQIDASPAPVASIINGSSGIKFKYKFKNNTFGFEPLIFLYQGWGLPESGVNSQLYNNGKGVYLKAIYRTEQFSSMLGYWSANKFIAPHGEYLFQSVSELDNTFSEDKRQLITARIGLKHKISKSFDIELCANGYYDIINKDLAHSIGLYLFINENFFIKKIKPKTLM